MYAAKDIANVSDINVAVKNKTVIEIVEKCLEGTDLTFEVKGNAIVIKKLERPLVTVSGWVRDSDGEALIKQHPHLLLLFRLLSHPCK